MPSKSNEGAKEDTDGEIARVYKAPLVTEPARKQLNQRQVVDYKEERRLLSTWLRNIGKNPSRGKGYASDAVCNRAYRIGAFYRWVWEFEGAYTTTLTADHADAYCRELFAGDYSDNRRVNTQKTLKSLFKWRQYQRGGNKWESTIALTGASPSRQPKDFLERGERTVLRKAALGYGAVPHYNSLSADEHQIWKRHLAQRFGIPVGGVNADTLERANGWKTPFLVQAMLDGGLRPKEVGQARVSWADTDNNVLRIPSEDTTKSNDSWTVAIRPRASQALQRWIGERECYDKYSGTDRSWLTGGSNPYGSTFLNRLLENLCEQAEIDTTHRDLS